MPVDRTRAVVEIVGLVAVVLSLLLVAYEVRQSNRIAQATTTYEIARDVNQFNELGYSDTEFARLLLLLSDGSSEYSDVQGLAGAPVGSSLRKHLDGPGESVPKRSDDG